MGMTRGDWEKRLKRFGKGVCLPSRLELEGDEAALRVVLPARAVSANMQTDDAAFEAWCLALHVAGAKRITLGWKGTLGVDGHSNRFRHRLVRFWSLFRPWFDVESSLAGGVYEMLPAAAGPAGVARWVLNVQSRSRPESAIPGRFALDASEHDLELAIAHDPAFRATFGLEYVSRQLPVGVFDGEVTGTRAIFTAKKSAIDLWGPANGSGRLALFELKNGKNVKAGALSELFLYATLMREVQKGTVRFDDRPELDGPSYQDIPTTRGVDAFVLAPTLHPILAGDGFSVLRTLNAAFDAAGEPIRFDLATFDANGKVARLDVPSRPARQRALGS